MSKPTRIATLKNDDITIAILDIVSYEHEGDRIHLSGYPSLGIKIEYERLLNAHLIPVSLTIDDYQAHEHELYRVVIQSVEHKQRTIQLELSIRYQEINFLTGLWNLLTKGRLSTFSHIETKS